VLLSNGSDEFFSRVITGLAQAGQEDRQATATYTTPSKFSFKYLFI
jgi:hypothetical protein